MPMQTAAKRCDSLSLADYTRLHSPLYNRICTRTHFCAVAVSIGCEFETPKPESSLPCRKGRARLLRGLAVPEPEPTKFHRCLGSGEQTRVSTKSDSCPQIIKKQFIVQLQSIPARTDLRSEIPITHNSAAVRLHRPCDRPPETKCVANQEALPGGGSAPCLGTASGTEDLLLRGVRSRGCSEAWS